jgi:oxygen-dependent protoporphyrinogen oxidase
MTLDVAIVGGGISGLATAYELRRRGYRVAVLERQVRAGGNAVSERFGGFLMEHGPSSLNASIGAAPAWSRELDLERQRLDLGPEVRRRYLTGDGALHGIATHPLGFITSDYLSLGARLRLLAEVLVPANKSEAEETVAEFGHRRFGAEFTDRVIDPLVSGMFAGKAEALSVADLFPRLVEMERRHGSLGRAVLASRMRGGTMPGRRLFSWRDGMGALSAALGRRLGETLRTGLAVRRIVSAGAGFRLEAGRGGGVEARAVVLATQPHVAAALLEPLDPSAAEAAGAILAPPIAVVFLGYARNQVAHPLDGLGYLTPRGEGRKLTGTLFCSTMFPGRAPAGHVALAAYLGGARAPELATLPEAELVALARDEFRDLLGARGDPVVSRVRQWARGLPQYGRGHRTLIAALAAAERRWPGLYLTGNYFSGPSVAACLAEATEAAGRAARHLCGGGRSAGAAPERPSTAARLAR